MVEGLRAIAGSRRRRDDVFIKVGDSNTANRAFMRCFAGGDVRLAGRDHLRPTIDHFLAGRILGTDPFRRSSSAARSGWSVHGVLAGDPPQLRHEIQVASPRFALVGFGTNDIDGRRPHVFARRLWRVLSILTSEGVIPVVSSMPPRLDDPAVDQLVPYYNLIMRGLAKGLGLPFVDVRGATLPLPRGGIASDGIHWDVFIERGRLEPCDFSETGLAHGHNTRNLLQLEMLHRLRVTVLEGHPAIDEPWPLREGSGTDADPFVLSQLPAVFMGATTNGRHVHMVNLQRRTSTRAQVIGRSSPPPRLVVGRDGDRLTVPVREPAVVELGPGPNRFEVVADAGEPYLLVVQQLDP